MAASRIWSVLGLPLALAGAPGAALAQSLPPPADAAGGRQTLPPDILKLFELAHQAMRADRRGAAVAPVEQAIELAGQLPAGDSIRIRTLSQAGTLLWSVNRPDLATTALMSAAQQIEHAQGNAPPEAVRMTFHMLGVIHRDQRRHEDAVPWFQRAVEAYEALPESTPEEVDRKYHALAADLRALSWAQCRANDAQAAEATDQRRLAACSRLARPSGANACRDGKRTCVGRWMSQSH